MNVKDYIKDTLTLRGKEIPVKLCSLPVVDLTFYPENPRIYSFICGNGLVPDQEEIQDRLMSLEHVKELYQSIKSNGGLHDPIIVRDNVAVEGNSRLAAYRRLADEDPIKWGKVKCRVLPDDVGDDLVFTLLGEYHIIGRKDWAPYEQAGYVYRRHKGHDISVKQIASEVGLSSKKVGFLIKVYSFMVEHNDTDVDHWSYYLEYLKSSVIAKAREAQPKLDEVVVNKIKSGEISHAADIRDKLKVVAMAKEKILKRFVEGEKTLYQSYDSASDQGTNDSCFKKLHAFRGWIVDKDTEETIMELHKELKEKCIFELKKIDQHAEILVKKIKEY